MKKIVLKLTILTLIAMTVLCSCNFVENPTPSEHFHEFGDWTAILEPSCTTDGTQKRMCECGEFESEVVPATDHLFVEGVCTICNTLEPSPNDYFIFTECEDGTYSIKAKNTYTISGKIVIPETYNGKPVTEIPSAAFGNCQKITEVVIPDSITSIGTVAFINCDSLQKINIPKGISEIPQQCFIECENLEEVVMHDGIVKICYGAFTNCYRMTEIDIPSGLKVIEDCAFENCMELKSIYIPEGVESIGTNCFYRCLSLTVIKLPSTIKYIGDKAFFDCLWLNTIYLSAGIIRINTKAFDLCSDLSDIYFAGSEEEWNKIIIDSGNDEILSASIHYNYSYEQ